MREIDGFVVIVHPKGSTEQVMFGLPVSGSEEYYECLEMNNQTPFSSKSEAYKAEKILKKRSDIEVMGLASIKMEVAETFEEMESLKSKGPYAVIFYGDLSYSSLMGDLSLGTAGCDYKRDYMSRTEWLPTGSFQHAMYIAGENNRQYGGMSLLTTFKMKLFYGKWIWETMPKWRIKRPDSETGKYIILPEEYGTEYSALYEVRYIISEVMAKEKDDYKIMSLDYRTGVYLISPDGKEHSEEIYHYS